MKVYRVQTYLENNKWWVFHTIGLPNAFGQSRKFKDVHDDARDVISMITDEDPQEIEVIVTPVNSIDDLENN